MTSGTLKDKISALSIFTRDNPKYTLTTVENLLKSCASNNRKDSLNAIIALKELFS